MQNKWQTINRGAATLGRVYLWIRACCLLRKGIAAIDFVRFQSGGQPLDALRRRGTVVPDSFTLAVAMSPSSREFMRTCCLSLRREAGCQQHWQIYGPILVELRDERERRD